VRDQHEARRLERVCRSSPRAGIRTCQRNGQMTSGNSARSSSVASRAGPPNGSTTTRPSAVRMIAHGTRRFGTVARLTTVRGPRPVGSSVAIDSWPRTSHA
jgi:hypothetical protein